MTISKGQKSYYNPSNSGWIISLKEEMVEMKDEWLYKLS